MAKAKTNVLNPEYEKLQTEVIAQTGKWAEVLSQHTLVDDSEIGKYETPVIPQLKLNADMNQYKAVIQDLFDVLKKHQPALAEEIEKVTVKLDEETLLKWFDAAISINVFYFKSFAEQANTPEWLVQFAAETAVRPFLQKAQAEINESLKNVEHKHACPACGEPPRFALLGNSGRKEVTCPRCHYAWEEKKISCAHCGTEEPGQIVVIKVEKEDNAQIHACKSCNGYTKVIDVKRLLEKAVPELLDLRSIHLDFIAQEKGYGIGESNSSH